MKTQNLILLADAYKYSHHKLYLPGTTKVYSYLESRGGQFSGTIFYGLQYILKKFLCGRVITQEKLAEAESVMHHVYGRNDVFDSAKFQYIIDHHDGKLPIRIKSVKEGLNIPVSNVLMTIENTDPQCYWLTNFLETLLMQVWYPCTVATLSHEIKKTITDAYERTASLSSLGSIEFVLNDFGFRGVSSVESAGIGGSAHLINFRGSDTIAGSMFIQDFYGSDSVYGLSIPATEHSICALKGEDGELEVFKHVLKSFPTGIVACVSDTYNIIRAAEEYWGKELKTSILEREGTLVIRPDSGDPIKTLLKLFDILFEKFEFTINEKGFKVLPPQVRVIQGDGIDFFTIQNIYKQLEANKISAENLALGMGGALLQKLHRDTQKFAIKCSYTEIDGISYDVRKRPMEIGHDGHYAKSFKTSKAGQLKLIKIKDKFKTISINEYPEHIDLLETVFENGQLKKEYHFDEIRNNVIMNKKELLEV